MTRISHAGELVGHDKWGRPIRVPAGGAADGAIVVDDRDDDDPDDSPDGDVDPDTPPTRPGRKQTYRELMDANQRLQAAVARNNRENAAYRHLTALTKEHNLTPEDLTALVAQRQGTPPAETEPPVADAAPPPAAPPTLAGEAAAPAPPVIDETEITRRVEAEIAKRGAADAERAQVLADTLVRHTLESGLRSAGYTGSMDVAAKIIDVDSLAVGEDGVVAGVDAAVESLRGEIPALFRRPGTAAPPRRGGSDVDGGDKRGTPPPKKDWAARAIDSMIGRP